MDLRIIYLPSGGLAETHGNVVRLTTPSAGALAAHRLTRREIQEATVAEAEVAVGRKLVPGQWWLHHRRREDHGDPAGPGPASCSRAARVTRALAASRAACMLAARRMPPAAADRP